MKLAFNPQDSVEVIFLLNELSEIISHNPSCAMTYIGECADIWILSLILLLILLLKFDVHYSIGGVTISKRVRKVLVTVVKVH